jgi:hypothetical protein
MSKILANRIKTHIDSAIKDLIYIDDCKNEEENILSRGLVAICLSAISGLPYKDIAKYITDGTNDHGIDGCYHDPQKNKLFLIQSKWSSGGTKTIGTGEVHKFIKGAYDVLDLNWKTFNSRFGAISAEISAGIANDPEIVLLTAYNSDNPLSGECKELFDKFIADNNTDDQDVVSCINFPLTRMIRALKNSKSGGKSDVELSLLEWGEHKEPYYSIYGKISCADIAEWHKEHGDLLFSENIRYTLSSSEINKNIADSLTNHPADFWYMNNGITAICDDLRRKPVGLGEQRESSLWTIGNVKIVNGAQTTSAISEAYKKSPKSVKKGYVQIKVISLSKAPLDIANQVTTATNTQNKVEPRDFLALDTLQDGLAESFKKIDVQYCYRRGEVISDKSKGLEVQELALSLATCSPKMSDVVMAKRNVGSLTDPNGHYQKIFSTHLDAAKTWGDHKAWRAAQSIVAELSIIKSDRAKQISIHGNRFIENRLVRNYRSSINLESAEEVLADLTAAIDAQYKEGYLAVLFKNAKKCEILAGEIDVASLESLSKFAQQANN